MLPQILQLHLRFQVVTRCVHNDGVWASVSIRWLGQLLRHRATQFLAHRWDSAAQPGFATLPLDVDHGLDRHLAGSPARHDYFQTKGMLVLHFLVLLLLSP